MHNARAFCFVCVGLLFLIAARPASAQCQPGLRPIGVGNSTSPFQYVEGQEYALTQGLAPGNYQVLDFSRMDPPMQPCTEGPCAGIPTSGGALLRCMMALGLGCCVDVNQSIAIQTGVSSGTIDAAIDDIFDDYGDIGTEYPLSQTNAYPVYKATGGNGSRVLPVPLVEFIPAGCAGNNCWGKANGFAGFFLKRRFSQSTFYGEFVPIPETPTPAMHSTWGSIKVIYR